MRHDLVDTPSLGTHSRVRHAHDANCDRVPCHARPDDLIPDSHLYNAHLELPWPISVAPFAGHSFTTPIRLALVAVVNDGRNPRRTRCPLPLARAAAPGGSARAHPPCRLEQRVDRRSNYRPEGQSPAVAYLLQ